MTPDGIDAALFRARVPAIAMLRTPKATDPGTPGCWFGGEPTLPPEIPGPIYEYRNGELGIALDIPMHFLVQINLDYLPRVLGLPQLPEIGTLFAFFDPAFAAAYEGEDLKLGKGCRLIYSEAPTLSHARRGPPPMPDLSGFEKRAYKKRTGQWLSPMSPSYNLTSAYATWPIRLAVFETYPKEEDFYENTRLK